MEEHVASAGILTTTAPKDKYLFVYWTVYYIGLIILLPWNILITVNGYWDYKFRNVTASDGDSIPDETTDLQKVFTSYVAIASNVPNATFIVLHAIFGHKFRMSIRIVWCQVGQIVVYTAIVVLAILNSDQWQTLFLVLNLVAIVFMNAFSAIFQGGMSSRLGPFPVEYMGSWVNGAGMGGLLPSLMNVAVLATKANFQTSGFICFVIAAVMNLVCLVLTILLNKSPFYRHYVKLSEDDSRVRKGILNLSDLKMFKEILADSWIYQLITLVNFITTLAIFPAATVLIEPALKSDNDWNNIYFVPVVCFVVYNLGDLLGKHMAVWIQLPGPSLTGQLILAGITVARIALIPLIFYCNLIPGNRNTAVVFTSEGWYIFFMVLLAVSNGYVGNIACMFGPKVVKPEYQQETAAFLVAFLVIGCGLGSILSNPIVTSL